MNYKIVKLQEKTVVGISARTNNSSPEMSAVIGSLWEKFYGGIYQQIPHKVNEFAMGIYAEYENDEKGGYTVMTACEVSSADENNLLKTLKIPAGKYAEFVIEGDMNTSEQLAEIGRLWQEIWKMNLDRSYVADFEEYRSADPDKADIHIFIGLK